MGAVDLRYLCVILSVDNDQGVYNHCFNACYINGRHFWHVSFYSQRNKVILISFLEGKAKLFLHHSST